jgi:hypothetical protein
VSEDGFEHGAGVVDRKADSESDQRREQKHFLHPGARVEFAFLL